MSPLLAFNYTQEAVSFDVGGHYDAEQELWVGGNVSVSNVELEIGGGETNLGTTTVILDGNKVVQDCIKD